MLLSPTTRQGVTSSWCPLWGLKTRSVSLKTRTNLHTLWLLSRSMFHIKDSFVWKHPNKFFSFSYSHQADTAQVVCRVYATAGIKYWRDTSSCSRIRWRTLWWTISVGQRGPCQLNEEIVSSFTKYCKVQSFSYYSQHNFSVKRSIYQTGLLFLVLLPD